jgi:glycosyltransferase involved in cell wall biosynthesis
LGDRVRFVGPVLNELLPDWYRAADVVVLPSRSEGVPNVLLEAAACGTPFVASRVGGIPEIAHLGPSRLVPPGDVESLATALKASLALPRPTPSGTPPRTRADAAHDLIEVLGRVCRTTQTHTPLAAVV